MSMFRKLHINWGFFSIHTHFYWHIHMPLDRSTIKCSKNAAFKVENNCSHPPLKPALYKAFLPRLMKKFNFHILSWTYECCNDLTISKCRSFLILSKFHVLTGILDRATDFFIFNNIDQFIYTNIITLLTMTSLKADSVLWRGYSLTKRWGRPPHTVHNQNLIALS